jgi:PRTRC genetic system ParB family protein
MTTATKQILSVSPTELKDFKGGNTRRKRVLKSFNELVESIRISGIIHMPVVRPSDDGGYEVVVGHNRRDGAIEAGMSEIDVEVRELSDREALALHLEENLVREGLSLSDQVEAAKRWVSFFQGDRESAAKRMSWSVKQLNERMELVNCTEAVMNALDDGQIAAGHALILSTMPERLQNGSVKTIINEKLTVNQLRQRAAKVRLPLASAKFDQADCQGCQHNSEKQAGLFGTADDAAATCSNATCYRTKTQAHLSTSRQELEEKFGKVLFFTESMSSDRNTVDSANVGAEQFEKGCMPCADRAALLDDRPTKEGSVLESQCLNVDCFKSCVAKFQAPKQAPAKVQEEKATTDKSDAGENETSGTKATDKKAPAKQAVAYTPSNTVIEQHKAEVVAFGREQLAAHESFRLAVAVASVEQAVDGARSGHEDMPSRVAKYAAMSKQDLMQALSATVTKAIANGSSFGSRDPFSFFSASIKSLELTDAAVKAWKPTADGLKPYTIEGIKSVCSDSGFIKHQDKVEDNNFAKLSGSGKGGFIKGVVSSDFDWTEFAPAAYLNLLK